MYTTLSLSDQIIHGTVNSVEQLVTTGADVNALDEYGYTPLIETAIVNNIEMAKILLAHGANPNGIDLTGRTALHWAVDNNNVNFCELLLKNKANPNHYTSAGQSPLIFALLRNHIPLKRLLIHYGANINFALDFINAKLLGHRFELKGYADIIDTNGKFIPVDYEGFFLEFTINTIFQSLRYYQRSYANKKAREYVIEFEQIRDTFSRAIQLIHYQHYLINIEEYAKTIDDLLNHEIVLLPIANEGHAITLIKYGNFWVKCDRGANSKIEGSVILYRINNTNRCNTAFLKKLFYEVHTRKYIQRGINQELNLEPLLTLPLPSQLIGNCSWANMESTIPALLFLLLLKKTQNPKEIKQQQENALSFYNKWQRWDQDRALNECIQSFYHANAPRKATKAAIVAHILFQKCRYSKLIDLERAGKILSILKEPSYLYILKSYMKIYGKNKNDEMGNNLRQILDHFGLDV
ncbi:MAG: hypothetical protein LEGION0398_MBIBDBAK_00893 [Legionellaceae bacterium]